MLMFQMRSQEIFRRVRQIPRVIRFVTAVTLIVRSGFSSPREQKPESSSRK